MIAPDDDVLVSSGGASAVTLTSDCTLATDSLNSWSMLLFTVTSTRDVLVTNPVFVTATEYSPGSRPDIVNAPNCPVCTLRSTPNSLLTTLTSAPASASPCWSTTRPPSVDVICAAAVRANTKSAAVAFILILRK